MSPSCVTRSERPIPMAIGFEASAEFEVMHELLVREWPRGEGALDLWSKRILGG